MKYFSNLLSVTVAALVSSTVAYAADLPAPVFVEEPELPPVEVSGGWYLRGDLGYKVYRKPKVHFPDRDFTNEKLDNTGIVGIGVGYRVNDMFRTDVTLDYEWDSDFSGNVKCMDNCNLVTNPSYETATVDVWTVLWNAYADLGYYNGFTPYVGAGIGASHIRVKDVEYLNPKTDGTFVKGKYPGGSDWSLSWALMAGVGYEIDQNWKIDAGYRYLHIGEVATAKIDSGGHVASIKYEDLAAHEVRVGLRYEFGGSYDRGYDDPIVTKY